ncbi:MAG: FMN-binding protein [Lachnospiraceae bacterium]|jgi:electron transport complex protein RnfG|nr:FMN-binding protein [Lachnospiraceae bacterium]
MNKTMETISTEEKKQQGAVPQMMKNAGVLFAITLIAGLVLGVVYDMTKDPIAKQKEMAVFEACQEVFPNVATFESMTYELPDDMIQSIEKDLISVGRIWKALASDQSFYGYVVEVTTKAGYQSDITLLLGVTDSGTLSGISLLSIAETPGLGMRAKEVLLPQFQGDASSYTLNEQAGSVPQTHIDAISGATITSQAITEAVNAGLTVTAFLSGRAQ